MTKREFASYFIYFALTLLILSTHWYWSFSLRSYVEPAVNPIYDLYQSTAGFVGHSLNYLKSRERLTGRLQTLRKRNRALKEKVYRGEAALRENRQLRRFLDLPPRSDDEIIPVEVLQQNLSGWERTLRVNRGSDDGLRKNQLAVQVVGDTWVVRGRVLSTSSDYSNIILSSDPRFKIGARIQGVPGRQFVARGWGYRGIRIRNFPSFISVGSGSPVFTSAGSTLAPQQLLLGKVSLVRKSGGESNIGRMVKISPPVFEAESLLWVIVDNE